MAFNKAIKLEPKNTDAWYYVGHAYIAASKAIEDTEKKAAYLDQAQEAFRQLQELDDDDKYHYIVCENGTPEGVGTMSLSDGELDEQEGIEVFVQ